MLLINMLFVLVFLIVYLSIGYLAATIHEEVFMESIQDKFMTFLFRVAWPIMIVFAVIYFGGLLVRDVVKSIFTRLLGGKS